MSEKWANQRDFHILNTIGSNMKRAVTFAILAFFTLVVTSLPHTIASSNLLESGTTHNFDSSIVYVDVLDDNTILFLESDGTLISGTNQNGKITELWNHELNVNASLRTIR